MENAIPIVELDAMDINGLKKLRKEMSRRIHNLKVRDSLRVNVYIAAEIRDKIDSAVKWAYARKYIKKPSYWSFCKFCINNTVLYVTGEIMKEEAEKARLNIGQAMMASLMNRSFKKNTGAEGPAKVDPVNTRNVITQRVKINPEVREEFKTDGGTVAEIKSASVKGQVI